MWSRYVYAMMRRGWQAFSWVKPLAAIPRFTSRAATAEMMSGSDCAEVLPVKKFAALSQQTLSFAFGMKLAMSSKRTRSAFAQVILLGDMSSGFGFVWVMSLLALWCVW